MCKMSEMSSEKLKPKFKIFKMSEISFKQEQKFSNNFDYKKNIKAHVFP